MHKNILYTIIVSIIMLGVYNNSYCAESDKPLIFPIPLNVKLAGGQLEINGATEIILTNQRNKSDKFLAQLLSNDFSNKFLFPIKIGTASELPQNNFILIGDLSNQLVNKFCEQNKLKEELNSLGDEGYILIVNDNGIVVAANKKNGALYGLESLRQIIKKENGKIYIPKLTILDKPNYSFRGIKLYLPGKDHIPFFKRFVSDFMAYYKFNKVILELNANMRLDSHPELNIGAVEFAKDLKYKRLDRPPGPHNEYQNSTHYDVADGGILEKEDVADIVKYIRQYNIEVIPELPSLTHAYYLLAGRKELAENKNAEYPDTYCPLEPEIYKIYFDVLDEYIDVIHPKIIHVGHDEWRVEKDICDKCRGKDYGKLFADDVNKIHDYLSKKGIKIAIWGDHLLESVRKKDHRVWKTSTGYEYKIPGALKPEQVKNLIPKDITIFNWFWSDINNDKQVSNFGFNQVYGNLRPDIPDWSERKNINGVLGGAPSSWEGTMEKNFGKDLIYDFLGGANLLWSEHYVPTDSLAFITQSLTNEIRVNLSGKTLPSQDGLEVIPMDISQYYNSSLNSGIDSLKANDLKSGKITSGNQVFDLNSSGNKRAISVSDNSSEKDGIKINEDVSSIIFLHACAKEAQNEKAYNMMYNFDDSAELLGWYDVVYEDGFVQTIPIRYGVNILDWNYKNRILSNEEGKSKYAQNKYAYEANAISCSKDSENQITFFAFEWTNKRFGKKIKEVILHSTNNINNAVILTAVSITKKRSSIKPVGVEEQ